MDAYDIQGLYQKTGFLLQNFMQEMQLSEVFIQYCKDKIGKSTRYLIMENAEDSFYNSEWELVVPEGLFEITDQGGDELV